MVIIKNSELPKTTLLRRSAYYVSTFKEEKYTIVWCQNKERNDFIVRNYNGELIEGELRKLLVNTTIEAGRKARLKG